MARGEHFFVWRHHRGVPFQHHAIDLGDGTAVHFTDGQGGAAGPGGMTSGFEIQRTTLKSVLRGGRDTMHRVQHQQSLPACVVVSRALSQVGRRDYHLVFDNCEHFACWCVAGRDESRQIAATCERLGAAGAKAVVAGSAALAGKAGARSMIRGASPWMIVADAAQWITEAGGHQVGLRDPLHRKQASRAVGMATALGVGASGGPAGVAVAGGLWAVGELAGELSRLSYRQLRARQRRREG